MKKKDGSRVDTGVTGFGATTTKHSHQRGKNSLFVYRENTVFLTSLLGTQLLLTESSPVYPLMKTGEFETKERAQAQ